MAIIMKLVYKGKFGGDPADLPHGEHQPNAVKFKEAENPKKLAVLANIFAIFLTVITVIGLRLRGGSDSLSIIGALLSLVLLFPHEILHALCFKETVYLYTNWKQGMLFVTGPEIMSKSRFIFMSLCPNIVFGFLPYIAFMIFPKLNVIGTLGAVSIGMGAADYYNVFNAITQMPNGAKTYLYQFNSYWFMPQDIT